MIPAGESFNDERTPLPFQFRCLSRTTLPPLLNSLCQEMCSKCDVAVSAGGDMAAAHSGWSLDSPIPRYGVCFYCWLGKAEWFDVDKCKTATRRNLLVETCLAHLNPFDLYRHAPGLPSLSLPP
eukprot:5621944-Pleurochrysis_carterae.AAC.1